MKKKNIVIIAILAVIIIGATTISKGGLSSYNQQIKLGYKYLN